MIRGVIIAFVIALLTGCIVKRFVSGPRLTGTCHGACDHYIECKAGAREDDRTRCETECPDVFSDRESLRAYESLSCTNAVEYVDGTQPRAATTHLPP
jgi:hypothetical protein